MTGVRRPAAPRVGDRIEGALEQRADAEAQIAAGQRRAPGRRRLLRTAFWLTLTGVSLYVAAPALARTAGSWDDLATLTPGWAGAALALQGVSVVCLWWLQHVAIRGSEWHAVATSQLAGNAMAKVAPGGGAVGAALQYRLLVQAGVRRSRAVAGLTASNLLTLAIVLALPLLALPALVRGAVDRNLVEVALSGLAIFTVMLAVGALALIYDRPLLWVGGVVQRLRNRLRPRSPVLHALPARLLTERDQILRTVGGAWPRALTAAVGRWAFDYATLLALLAAVGSRPRPSLVLLAFCAAQLLAQLPLTPGGLGFVEAGLTGTLVLAGVAAGDAVLATLAYRLLTYWLPLPLGVAGGVLHRQRYRRLSPMAARDGHAPPR